MCLRMAEKVGVSNISLNKMVVAIEQDGEGATVVCSDGSKYKAKKVITTLAGNAGKSYPVPRFMRIKTLSYSIYTAGQYPKIRFSPPLPIGRQSLYKTAFLGNLMKVYVVYRESFWTQAGYSGEIVSSGGRTDNPACEDGPLCITYDATTKKGTPVLIGFIGGTHAKKICS